MPATEATLTIAPCRRAAIRTPTLRATRNVPRRSILTSRSHWSIRTRSMLCILPNTPAALTRPVIGPCAASMSATPFTTAPSLATSNGAGHRIACVPGSGSGKMSVITTRWPWPASSVAVAAPMPRLPPVTRTIPSAAMAVALVAWLEQPARDQFLIRGDHVLRHGRHRAAGIGIAPAEIAARAHQHLDDRFEFLVAEIIDRAGLPRALQDADIGGRNVVKVLLIAGRRKELGLVENAQEFRNLADEIEEGAEPFDFLPRRMRGAGSIADEADHVDADLRQQLVEQFLAVFEMIVERALGDAGLLGDAGDGGFGIAVFADHLGRGIEDFLLGPGVTLDAIELGHLGRCGLRHALASSSARSTRLSTLPEGFLGRLSRMISCFGTLKPASFARQWSVRSGSASEEPSARTTIATGFSPHRSSRRPMTATSRTCGNS